MKGLCSTFRGSAASPRSVMLCSAAAKIAGIAILAMLLLAAIAISVWTALRHNSGMAEINSISVGDEFHLQMRRKKRFYARV